MPTAITQPYSAAVSIPAQPERPTLATKSQPGPEAQRLMEELGQIIDPRTYQSMVDYEASLGNYIADADGNVHLDVFAQIASIAIGYNNPDLLALASTHEFQVAASNRPALGSFPPKAFFRWLDEGLMKIQPRGGLDQIVTTLCGSSANENAFKAAFMAYRARERALLAADSPAFTPEEIDSCMLNQLPGSPQLSILSFTSAFHGRLFGSLSATRSKAIHKLDIPAFDWPVAPFPQLKYPLEKFEQENEAEELECLKVYEAIIKEWKGKSPVAAVIVEPILSEGGDKHASPAFFRELIKIAHRHGAFFIVDEVQTGFGATGTFWAHDHWALSESNPEHEFPDFVSFSKKAQASGFFHRRETRPTEGYRNYNTWMGSPVATLQAKTIISYIETHSLLSHTATLGSTLFTSLATLFASSPKVANLRGKGRGTFIAWDCESAEVRNRFVGEMRKKGVLMGGCGDKTIRLRPMLIFGQAEAQILLDAIEAVLKEL